ncbi:MAG: pseudouridine synthase [Caldimonas sp.]
MTSLRPELVHLDAHCIVAVKPAGLLSVPGRGADLQDCLAVRIRACHDDALVVHRLDMATSGLIVFARGIESQRRLNAAFAQREVAKTYIAVVAGRVAAEHGEVDLPICADWPNRPRQMIDHRRGKAALTRYRVVDREPDGRSTRIELEPVTGRAHQLRVHMLALGHPILGDALYAPDDVQRASARLMLHAAALRFAHPASGAPVCIASSAPF